MFELFELKYPSEEFKADLAVAIDSAHAEDVPCCLTRSAIHEQALRVGTWEYGPQGEIMVWLDKEGEFKLLLPE
jgi:hypothetical protein